jgi:hypothetical protein
MITSRVTGAKNIRAIFKYRLRWQGGYYHSRACHRGALAPQDAEDGSCENLVPCVTLDSAAAAFWRSLCLYTFDTWAIARRSGIVPGTAARSARLIM